MDLATAEKLIPLENAWIEYSKRLAEAERDPDVVYSLYGKVLLAYKDPIYDRHGRRWRT